MDNSDNPFLLALKNLRGAPKPVAPVKKTEVAEDDETPVETKTASSKATATVVKKKK